MLHFRCSWRGGDGARNEAAEYAIDRQGGDYKDFEVAADANGDLQVGVRGRQQMPGLDLCPAGLYLEGARCFPKHEIKPPRRKPCCISGVVR